MSVASTPKATGFFTPYLVVRVIPAVYVTVALSEHANSRQLIARARDVMERTGARYPICLVLSRVRGLYLNPNGSSTWSSIIPFGGIRLPLRRVNWRALWHAGER